MAFARSVYVVLPAAALLAWAVPACRAADDDAPFVKRDVLVSNRATLMSGADVEDVTLAPDRLIFQANGHASLRSKIAGDILVGERGSSASANRTGFLRKVKSIAEPGDGTIVVMTDPALLNEVVREGAFQGVVRAPADLGADLSTSNAYSIHPRDTTSSPPVTLLDWSGKDIFRISESAPIGAHTIGYEAHATFQKGSLVFTPSFDIGADIKLNPIDPAGSVKEFHVIATGALEADTAIEIALSLTGSPTGDDLAQLIAQKIVQQKSAILLDKSLQLGSIAFGPLNMPVNAEVKIVVTCDLAWGGSAGVVVGGDAKAQVTAGFRYQAGAMTPIATHSEALTMIGPTWTLDGAVAAKCTVRPEFDIALYDVAAGEIWAEPYASIRADAQCDRAKLTGNVSGEARAGVSAGAHAKVDLFGLYTWDKSCTLFDVESPMAQVNGSFALPGGTHASCTEPAAPPTATAQDAPLPNCFSADPQPNSPANSGTADASAPHANEGVDGGADVDCRGGNCGACDHDTCATGDALGNTCTMDTQSGACIQSICQNDPYCCDFSWSASCVAHVTHGDYACTKRSCP